MGRLGAPAGRCRGRRRRVGLRERVARERQQTGTSTERVAPVGVGHRQGYVSGKTRRTCGARGEDGKAVAKGSEVVVTRYEKGIAYVRLWTEISGEQDSL